MKSKCVSVRHFVCVFVCMLRMGERLDGFVEFIQGSGTGSLITNKYLVVRRDTC